MSTIEDTARGDAIAGIARREAIAEYRVVGQPPEPDLEGLVQLAATICGVSTAVINIIDDRSQHQIAAVGFEPSVCAREDSMCAVVFRHPGHVVVPDAREDERFRDNPFVTGEIADVRFYASSPLITPAGVPIGTLCVFDERVGDLAEQDSQALALLARQVIDVLELRRITRELGRSNEQLAHFAGQVSHDLRTPLTALGIFIFLAQWNNFFFPLIFLNTQEYYTLPLLVNQFKGQFSSDWTSLMAASTLAAAPLLIVFIIGQRHIVEGIALQGSKG